MSLDRQVFRELKSSFFTVMAVSASLGLASTAHAGSFIGSLGQGSTLINRDFILHPSGYLNGSGTDLNVKLCIVPGSPNADAMVTPVANIAATMTAKAGRTGNLLVAESGDPVPFSQWDFESVALHEVGHCLGLGHVNAASESGLAGADSEYTKAAVGANAALDLNAGADSRRGSADDQRSDDVGVHWFRRSTNNPCSDPGTSVFDATTFSVDLNDLPSGASFPANAEQGVCSDLGVANTEAIMQQGSPNGQSQRFLGHNGEAMLRLAMSGLDEIQGTSDDHTLTVESLGISDSAECDINLSFNNAETGFAVCKIGYGVFTNFPNHGVIVQADAYFNTSAVSWFFNTSSNSTTYTIGGTVSGLAGSGLVLQNNGEDDLPIDGDGAFAFETSVPNGSEYSVSVGTQPGNPAQTCSVDNASGTISGADVTDVQVTCVTNAYTVGGNVSGLAGSGLVLQNNGGDDLPIGSDGSFTFSTAGIQGTGYSVTVKTQPSDLSQTCTVNNGVGTIGTSNVTSVSVSCVTNTFTIGGTVTGLSGSGLVLQNNGGDNLAIGSSAPFSFNTALADGSGYLVSVLEQPSSPAQTCEVTNASGTLAGQNVVDVLVTCRLNCLVNTVAGVTDTGVIEREACDILQIGPSYSADSTADVMWSSGSAILIETETRIEKGANLNAAVCGQSLCEVSDSPMPAGCHSCVVDICEVNPSCCSEDFDATCVEQVSTVCGLACE